MKKNTVQFQLDYLARNFDHVLARLTDIETRLSRLEVFTGMRAPAPFPAAEDAAPLVFSGGDVDEMTRAGSGMGEDEVLPY